MVLKGNKFQPVFSPVTYDIALSEDIAVGLNVVNVSASDEDIGSQGEITYGMHGDHRYLDFRIDTFNGSIFTNYPLDRERQTLYTLDIIASDGGNPNRFATAAVSIRILDLNDNTPVWDQTQYFTSLIENITVGSTVISVGAMDLDQVDQFTDPDTGETTFSSRNGYVTYSITDGNPENQFGIDEDTGVVTIVSTLDREVFPEYNLTLNATDGPGLLPTHTSTLWFMTQMTKSLNFPRVRIKLASLKMQRMEPLSSKSLQLIQTSIKTPISPLYSLGVIMAAPSLSIPPLEKSFSRLHSTGRPLIPSL